MLSWVVHWRSSSRASAGRTSDVRPRPCTWLSLSLVETKMVVPMRRRAPAANVRSGVAEKRLPPRSSAVSMRPSAAASTLASVCMPGVAGSGTPYSSPSRRANSLLRAGVTPTDPTPCTFEGPRIGRSPPPGGAPPAPRQRQGGERMDVADAVRVLGDAHGPCDDPASRGAEALHGGLDL